MAEGPQAKKAKITDHFRVALKPLDLNLHRNKQQQLLQQGKENPASNQQQQRQHHQSSATQQQQQHPNQTAGKRADDIEVITINDDTTIINNYDATIKFNTNSNATKQPPFAFKQPLQTTSSLLAILQQQQLQQKSLNQQSQQQPQQQLLKRKSIAKPVLNSQQETQEDKFLNKYSRPPGLKANILDHDETQLNNILAEPHYAYESYMYDRERELILRTSKYLENPELNHQITPRLRARFVDWLVLIQNDFRLDHEPLYMAVKLVDQYLSRKSVMKPNLELLFITSIFVSVKFEYRPDYVTIPELLQEFGNKYHKKQVINYEIDILSTLNFDIRFPLSYGFLRRFGRCTNASMKQLTLARYILESSLLEYNMIDELESKKAAASLLLSNKMLYQEIVWDEAAEFYTGYKEKELEPLALQLNEIISRPFDRKLGAIRRKYTSEVFLSVATIAPLVIT